MKQTAWTPSSLNPSVTLGEKIAVSSVLSIDTHSALINPALLSPVPSMPFRVKSHTGRLHIHPAFSFSAGIRYFVGSAKMVSADKNGAVTYIGTGKSDGGLNLSIYPVSLSITSSPSEIRPGDVLNIGVGYSAVWNFEVFYRINSGTPVLYSEISASGTVTVDTAGIPFNHNDTFEVFIKDKDSILYDSIQYTVNTGLLKILSLNNNIPLTLTGSYTDGTDYFFGVDGDIVDSSSPFRSGVYVGTGNADNNIDVDVKALAIDVDAFTVPVLLDIDFTASGTATLVSNKVYIEAYNGSAWVDLNNGNPIDVVLGEFELTTAQLKASDGFESGNVYVVRARDFDGYSTPASKNIVTIATVSMTTPVGVVAGEDYDYTGTSNGDEVELFYSPAGEDDWVSLGTSSVVDGDWTITGSIPDAGTYDFKAVDTTNENGFVQIDDVVVESGSDALLTMDATCVASETESLETILEIQTMDATCVASAPTSI